MRNIRDVLYGDMSFSSEECQMIDSIPFNRLRKIKQLAFGDFIFPNATHTRYVHSLGTATVIEKMFNAVDKNHQGYLTQEDKQLLRMMGLVHDLGHSPYSHSSIPLSEITHEDRLPSILNLHKSSVAVNFPSYSSSAIDVISQTYLGDGLIYIGSDKLMLLHEFMDSFLDADKLDYLRRDSYMCGLRYGNFEAEDLIKSLTLIPTKSGVFRLGITTDGLHALESFVLARYYMYSHVYLDPISCLYDKLYVREARGVLPNGEFPDDTKKFLNWDDSKLVNKLSFLEDTGLKLVYDQNFSEAEMNLIDAKFGKALLKDTIKKAIYRKDENDANVYVLDKVLGRVIPATELSPTLRGLEFAKIHRLRYYAPSGVADELRDKIKSLVGGAFGHGKFGV